MKKFLPLVILLFTLPSEARADVEIKLIPPTELAKSAGTFVLDTGKKLCEGVTTTAFGLGEIITSPFRADTYRPKKKVYYFKKPRLEFIYDSGKLYRK